MSDLTIQSKFNREDYETDFATSIKKKYGVDKPIKVKIESVERVALDLDGVANDFVGHAKIRIGDGKFHDWGNIIYFVNEKGEFELRKEGGEELPVSLENMMVNLENSACEKPILSKIKATRVRKCKEKNDTFLQAKNELAVIPFEVKDYDPRVAGPEIVFTTLDDDAGSDPYFNSALLFIN